MRLFSDIAQWCRELVNVMRRQLFLIFTDAGVMIFFLFLPIVYPVIYALIYNPEVTRDMPVAVVDHSRTALSREFVRHADATQAIKICGYASDLAEARRWTEDHRCFAVLEIPEDYARNLGRGNQAVVSFYCDMGLLLRYRTFLLSLTDLQIATCTELRQEALNTIGMPDNRAPSQVESVSYMMGDPEQGFASFILPAIIVLILQQSMLLGITMLEGSSNERRRRYHGYDPCQVDASPSATILGKTFVCTIIYFPLSLYILHFIPEWFAFPHQGEIMEYLALILPMLLATSFLGITLQWIISEREISFIAIVFTSVIFLFLSGITWPRYAMHGFLRWLSDLVPATWGVNGFVRINSNGADLAQQAHDYHWLWGLTGLFFVTAYITTRLRAVRLKPEGHPVKQPVSQAVGDDAAQAQTPDA